MKSLELLYAAGQLRVGQRTYDIFRPAALEKAGSSSLRIPCASIKIRCLRISCDSKMALRSRNPIEYVAAWDPSAAAKEINSPVNEWFCRISRVRALRGGPRAMRDALLELVP